jgi:2-polyprenyl-3-methyl-5-hydroxy-6-metoxy-1,4-benzoquinol methylase
LAISLDSVIAVGRGPLELRSVHAPDVLRAARLWTAYKGIQYLAVRRRLPSRLTGLTVLDVGSGIGHQAGLLARGAGLVVGVDSNEEALRYREAFLSYRRTHGRAASPLPIFRT